MGSILRLALGEGTTMMKLLISACLVALALAEAEPKADADPYYGYYGLGYHGLGYGLRAYGYGYPYAYGHYGYYGKRSADAEPAAAPEAEAAVDPYYGYYGLGYHGLGYRAYGGYYGHGLGYYGYGHGLYGYYGYVSIQLKPAKNQLRNCIKDK